MSEPSKLLLWDFDERRSIAVPGDPNETLNFSINHWIALATEAINTRGDFHVALSGGSTPKKLFEALTAYKTALDWTKVCFYFSDERCVPQDNVESNYHMALSTGLFNLVSQNQIFPMYSEGDPELAAATYDKLIQSIEFDLVMLGMGDDGHTASLFPQTEALEVTSKKAAANYVPDKKSWRITLTFDGINTARHIAIYVVGSSKASMVRDVLTDPYDPARLPAQKVGTSTHKALWILDKGANSLLC